jgi:hypothetical protein
MKLDVQADGADAVRQMLQRIGRNTAAQALAATAEDLEEFAGREASKHTKTGAIFRSLYKKRDGDGWEIGHDLQHAPQALFVHWGTKPHVIKPKKADGFASKVKAHTRNGHPVKAHTRAGRAMLRWPAGGAFVFAREVYHPGYPGDPWLARAAQQAPLMFVRHVEAVLAKESKA